MPIDPDPAPMSHSSSLALGELTVVVVGVVGQAGCLPRRDEPGVRDALERDDVQRVRVAPPGRGGGSEAGVVEAAIGALKPGGRLVANAVTTEMEAVLLALHAGLGGALIRIDIARAAPVGQMTGWRPAMPVTQWSWVKPAKDFEEKT